MEQHADAAEHILRALRFHPRGMTITEIARQTHITRNSVSKHLEVLRIAGQVDMRAVGNAKMYSLAQRVPLSAFLCFTRNLIVVLDGYGTIVQINDHLLSLTGMKKEEVIGENIREVPIPVVSVEETLKIIEGVEREQFVTDVRHTQNGNDSFYRMQVIPTVFEDGERGRTIVLEDITEKRCYVRNMEFLAKTAMEFVDFPEDTDIYERIAEMVHEFVPEGRILVLFYDEVRKRFIIRSVVNADFRNGLASLIGRDPVGMAFPLDEVLRSPFLENPLDIDHGIREIPLSEGDDGDMVSFYDLTFRRIPEDVCEEIIRTQDIGKAYVAFLVWKGRLLGDIGIFLSRRGEIEDIYALESFIRQASIAISRQMTEERLRWSNKRLRELIELSPFPAGIIDSEGCYTFINQSFTEIFGYTLADIPTGREWFEKAFPDPEIRKNAIESWKGDLEQAGPSQARPRMFPVRCKNGEVKQILFRPMSLCDNTQYVIYEDITELRQTHNVLLSDMSGVMNKSKELQVKDMALASLGCAVAITDAEGCITYVNPAFLSLWEYGSADEVAGRNTSELWADRADGENNILLHRLSHAWSGDLTCFRKDGSSFGVYGMLNVLLYSSGKIVGMVGSFVNNIRDSE